MSKSLIQSCCLHSNLFILPWQQRRIYNKVIDIVLLSMENYFACHALGSTHKAFILFHCRCANPLKYNKWKHLFNFTFILFHCRYADSLSDVFAFQLFTALSNHCDCCYFQKHDVSNDVAKIDKGEAQIMEVETVHNGQPEQNSSSPAVVKKKSVADASGEISQSNINAAKTEQPVREKHDTNGSSIPVKRKQVSEESYSESEDHAIPTKKPRSEAAKHLSDEEKADSAAEMSDEDIDRSEKTSPKTKKQRSFTGYEDLDEDEELGRMYDATLSLCRLLFCCIRF